ncbi:hypothetical protein EYF80_001679 [Liparis tanakae]|uniref:Uncharacterized protein n=1 Tax=Liparis tanakae TaxID=230148 RepID=A0A4Z2JEP2_9TELE|nr:hypothetical protein EYF80_001679 [Liparis tanakae]
MPSSHSIPWKVHCSFLVWVMEQELVVRILSFTTASTSARFSSCCTSGFCMSTSLMTRLSLHTLAETRLQPGGAPRLHCGAGRAGLCVQLPREFVSKRPLPPESHSSSSSRVRILDIERAQCAKRAAQTQHTERLCAAQKAQTDSVLKRLGFSVPDDAGPPPQRQASPKKSPESSLGGRRIRLISEDDKGDRTSRTNQTLQEEDPFFEKKLRLGSQMAIVTCKFAKFTDAYRSSSPDSFLSSVDMQTPDELRVIGQFSPSPPPTAATRRPSLLPVSTVKYGPAEKYVADGCKLQTAQNKVDNFVERLEKFHLPHHPPPQKVAAPRRAQAGTAKVRAPPSPAYRGHRHRWTTVDKPKVPAPPVPPCRRQPVVRPKVPAPPVPPYRRQHYHGPLEVKPKVQGPPVPPKKQGLHIGPKLSASKADQEDFQALVNPAESLSLCFKQMSSDEW